jgi:hypothetical protein
MDICTRVYGAAAFCARELLVENYGEHLAHTNRSTPLSESRVRNLSSPVFVVWQQYGRNDGDTGNGIERRLDTVGLRCAEAEFRKRSNLKTR